MTSLFAEAIAALLTVGIAVKSGFSGIMSEGYAPVVMRPLWQWSIPPIWMITDVLADVKTLLTSAELWCVNCALLRENIATWNLNCWAAFYDGSGPIPISSLPARVIYADGCTGNLILVSMQTCQRVSPTEILANSFLVKLSICFLGIKLHVYGWSRSNI